MRAMKIPNIATDTLLICFAILGLIALPFNQYMWHWSHFGVMLLVGIILNMVGAMGAGDSKFVAAAAPFVAVGDLPLVIVLLAASLLGGFATHRLARATPLRKIAPQWLSWETGNRFPMGFPLAMTLTFYLIWVLINR